MASSVKYGPFSGHQNGTASLGGIFSNFVMAMLQHLFKKPRILETKHLSTDADSSTDTTVGWTKNTPKPNFFEKQKKSFKTQKLKNV